ncbi:MAG: family 31 glucosidase [Christensenellaceae bacterium]|jgi:alpha-D-xyloside xylohydrolase|nr:family 31 glucosidase [Christensenellaceae bacterium]
MPSFDLSQNRLFWQSGEEKIQIEPWGKDGLRVRLTRAAKLELDENWALLPKAPGLFAQMGMLRDAPKNDKQRAAAGGAFPDAALDLQGNAAFIQNGKTRAVIDRHGYLRFENARGEELLRECIRNRSDLSEYSVPLNRPARWLKPHIGREGYRAAIYFEAYEGERLFGMGQYQEESLDLKGLRLPLVQQNSQISCPFLLSSRGYGFLWNNPAVGDARFMKNETVWTARSTRQIDYWICAGDSPDEILQSYASAVGTAPMMRQDLMGFWQCKLRYRTQEELLSVAREHKRQGLPMDAIVVDFFHWTMQGDWKFDPVDWPDPEGMVRELKSLGISLVVSVWPTVDLRSENFYEMKEKDYLIRNDRGGLTTSHFMGEVTLFDAMNPGARAFIWKVCKQNYYDKGIKLFWLDSAEPIYNNEQIDNLRYFSGPALETSNLYPLNFCKAFYEGLQAAGESDILCLIRCGWAGAQRYGALTWSGDVQSSFQSMRQQITAGINAGISGLHWWTTDIGGFLSGFPAQEEFRELLLRWFAWGAFQPVMRLHGDRLPYENPEPLYRNGVEQFGTGAENEVWRFGEKAYPILKKYLLLREAMKPYIARLMWEAHEFGRPPMRPLFYHYPADETAWRVDESYLFGPDLLVSPVYEAGAAQKWVYLPGPEAWIECATGKEYAGCQWVEADAPIEVIPLFLRKGAVVPGINS